MATYQSILSDIKSNRFSPVYLLDGEEAYFLDLLAAHFENDVLSPAEKDFNLTVMYGKDADWAEVVNACRRFPMFAERQVVILKDAALMKDLLQLEAYITNPTPSTVFVIEHRFKKVDGRSKMMKFIKSKYVHFTSDKYPEQQIPQWISGYGNEQGWTIGSKEAGMLAAYLGNDLQKIANELNKVRLNAKEEPALTPALIQKYIGISKDYNIFDFPAVLTSRQRDKTYTMLTYFVANPKSAPIPLLVGCLYPHFDRMYKSHFTGGNKQFSLPQVEKCIAVIADASAAFVGLGSNIKEGELLKEMVGKIEAILN